MKETSRKNMGDDGSFSDDGDVANLEDQFSDEITGYDVEDVVDVSIADDVGDKKGDDHGRNKLTRNGRDVSGKSHRSSSSNSSGGGDNKSSYFKDRRWLCWVGLSMIAAFSIGIIVGNTSHATKRIGHPPPTFGNPKLADEIRYPPPPQGSFQPKTTGPGQHVSPGIRDYGDVPTNVQPNGEPITTMQEQYQKRKRHFTTLIVEWSGAAAVATPLSPSRNALDWILDEDPFRMTTADRTLDVQQRYIMAVFYYATLGNHWSSRRRASNRHRRRERGRRLENHDSKTNDNEEMNTSFDDVAYFLSYRDVCHWNTDDGKTGVFCDENGVISRIEFRDFGLGGNLPQELGFLSALRSINVEYNDIQGTLPIHYGLLANLEIMKLENNQIVGRIPTELATMDKLEKLDLDGNYFTGILPSELANLKNIVKIEIGGSTLQGTIPKELSNLKGTLQKLDLKDNKFSGNVPSELGSLTKLNYLDLENNKLTGTIPIEFSSANSLQILYLNGNDLAGSLDEAFCNSNIGFFEFVADCSGATPEVKCSCCTSCCNSLGSECVATIEDLHENPVSTPANPPVASTTGETGTTSVDYFKLEQVLATISDKTLLEAKHTDQFKALNWMARIDPSPLNVDSTPQPIILQRYIIALIYISTSGKNWKDKASFLNEGGVCDWKGLICNNEGFIMSIDLEDNNLDGTIVSEIGALGPSLRQLQLGMNMLHGALPSEIGMLSGLTSLDLFDNSNLTGTIPSELSTKFLTKLKKIQLVGTGITGNLDPLFCADITNGGAGGYISANCFGPSVSCSCCKVCCGAAGDDCKVVEENS